MESDLFGYAIMAAFYGGLLFWLFVAVRRRSHPKQDQILRIMAYVRTLEK